MTTLPAGVTRDKAGNLTIDLMVMDMASNGPHWLMLDGIDKARERVKARKALAHDDYDPNEPRKPEGEKGGGEWTAGGGAAAPLSKPASPSASSKIISTRNVTAKRAKDAAKGYQRVDTESMKADPALYKHNVELFKRGDFYPGMRPDEVKGSTDQIASHVIDRMRQNLDYLVSLVPKDKVKEWAHWYEGAHKFAHDFGQKYGLDDAAAAGVIAALSPQKPWDENVYFADRVLDIVKNHAHDKWDAAMEAKGKELAARNPNVKKALAVIEGERLDQLENPAAKALWVRTYNEAHEDRTFHRALPNGTLDGIMKTATGAPDHASWGTLAQVANAIMAIDSKGDPAVISKLLGERHKVRSFYNNIIAPDDPNGDVTVDTHAVGAAWLWPTTGIVPMVWHDLQTNPGSEGNDPQRPKNWVAAKGSAIAGIRGTYPLYADAYRLAAKDLGLKPREVQSVAWEMKQRLFSDKLTHITIKRNGAGSTTSDVDIANRWDGEDRVVLRAHVPRTTVVSVPAYGQNLHSEHESVIAGTAWAGWDAWLNRAPTFEQVPMRTQDDQPLAPKISDEEAGKRLHAAAMSAGTASLQ